MRKVKKLPSDVGRCKGAMRKECQDCLRRISPPHDYQWYVRVWTGHGPCPDRKVEEAKE